MADFAYPESLKKLKIEISELQHVAVLGSAALQINQQKI